MTFKEKATIIISGLRTDNYRLHEAIRALSKEMKLYQTVITDEKVLIGFNMAVAICNKHLAENDDLEDLDTLIKELKD
jgi:hypothetical protein